MRKARIWGAFLINKRKFSENSNAWLTTEDSNSHIPDWEKAFEISELFAHFSRQFELGDFCSRKLRNLDPHPSLYPPNLYPPKLGCAYHYGQITRFISKTFSH
jgi:hypothetical protein